MHPDTAEATLAVMLLFPGQYGLSISEIDWSRSGDQGDAWRTASVTVYSSSFAFEYTHGGSYTGDAAVAQVVVTCGTPVTSHITCSGGSYPS